MVEALLRADGRPDEDPVNVLLFERQKLIEKYPLIVSRQFQLRVSMFMKIIRANIEIFRGKLIDHWWRIEFQNRGSPHLHMVIWIDGTPDFNSPDGIERIDQVMSCSIPEDDDDLKDLISKCQTHRHTKTCPKNTENFK